VLYQIHVTPLIPEFSVFKGQAWGSGLNSALKDCVAACILVEKAIDLGANTKKAKDLGKNQDLQLILKC
jgi:hypothetical protein